MPDNEYPAGYDADSRWESTSFDADGNNQLITGLMVLAAVSAVNAFGSIPALVTYGTTDLYAASTGLMAFDTTLGAGAAEVEAMIAADLIAGGATAAEAEAFIDTMAYRRVSALLISEAAKVDIANAAAAAALATALANAGVLSAAITTVAANVNYQAQLHSFFTSGM